MPRISGPAVEASIATLGKLTGWAAAPPAIATMAAMKRHRSTIRASAQILVEECPGARLGIRRGRRIVAQPVALAVRHGDRAVRRLAVEAVIGVGIVDRLNQVGPREARHL